MAVKVNCNVKAEAKAKIARMQRSPKYHSFFNTEAIEAFNKVESTAFAGTSIKRSRVDGQLPRA
jgi:hypothetical protein